MKGFRFRKSINLGLIRVNFSKSGVGWSFAVLPGFILYARAVNRDRYWTFSLPGTGLSKRTIARKSKRVNR
jgi:hypothetical protein